MKHREHKTFNGSALIFGDLHLFVKQDHRRPTGLSSHKDYNANSRHNIRMVLRQIEEFQGAHPGEPLMVFFLGDLFGVDQHVLTDNTQRSEAAEFLSTIKNLTGHPAQMVWGNHDRSSQQVSESDLFMQLGLLENPSWVDFTDSDGNIHWRWHLVNNNDYEQLIPTVRHGAPSDMGTKPDGGKARRKTLPTVEHVANGVLGHNHYYAGEDMRPHPGGGCIDLTTLESFKDVIAVIYGDTHEPSSDGFYPYTLNSAGAGHERYAMGLGSPARTSRAQDYEDAYVMWFLSPAVSGGERFDFEVHRFGARPASEVFLPEEKTLLRDVGGVVREATDDERRTMRGILQDLKGRTFEEENISSAVDDVLADDLLAARVAKAHIQAVRDTHAAG